MSADRLRPGLLAALGAGVLGLATGESTFMILALVPLAYGVFGYLSGAPEPSLRVERSVSDTEPRPGDDVTVTLAVENTGDRPLADLRVADDPPNGVPVDGPTQLATALRSGETATLSYDCSLPRGTFEFGTPVARTRTLAGAVATETEVAAAGADAVTCQTLLDAVPLQDHTIQYVGRTPTDSGGSGVEFYATRDYQPGDPVGRIDWRRYARTGELTTVDLREERAMTVVFLVDDRPDAQRTVPGYGPDSLDLSVYAVSRALPTLLDENHRVGVSVLSNLGEGAGGYVAPGGGGAVRTASETALENAGEESADSPDRTAAPDGGTDADTGNGSSRPGEAVGQQVGRRLAERLPPRTQVVCCTPLSDDLVTGLSDALVHRGHALTVLSPAIRTAVEGGDPSLGRRLATVRRETRRRRLVRREVPVVDWSLDAPLALALADVFGSWGRSL
ncbi:DUF58 domain-containing protein [Haloglomus irregulare]|jgi:uncharacterized repeat protein (TIGR01451 family)|uniref:DUF58 domain-containing protein n=1 Tax=Haloglomus irregulare TaxID=2234134 RepID=A0A554N7J4_9EURY|nr:DUF58 domain-containing protein [Haloglomus irregulare]TSD13371.1 DUF58 domain-containing protein [Haloglomus irregulare]